MDPCLTKLMELDAAGTDPEQALGQAITNLCEEWEQKLDGGNIPVDILDDLAKACRDDPPTACADLPERLGAYQTIRRRDDYPRRPPPPDNQPLRRVIPTGVFIDYHLLPADRPGSADAAANRRAVQHWARTQRPKQLDLDLMQNGHTGRGDAPSWWTFDEPGQDTTDDPRDYALELALTAVDAVDVYIEQGLVEIRVPGPVLDGELYKPCSLDAFQPGTRFRPDLSDNPWGRTHPEQATTKSRPELITRAIGYREWQGRLKHDQLPIRWLTITAPANGGTT